jgi:hypothetical protein
VTGSTVQAVIAKLMTERPTRSVVRDTVPMVSTPLSPKRWRRYQRTGLPARGIRESTRSGPGVRNPRRVQRLVWLLGIGASVLTLVWWL